MLAFLLLLGVALVASQQPKPCNSPTQFEARVYTTDYSKNFTQYAKISYDETNKREREVEELEFGSERDFYDVLRLHLQNREYRIDLKTRKCNATTLTRPFIPAGVPPDAHYEGEGNIGPVNIANEHVTVIRFNHKDSEGEGFGAVTSPDCLPVSGGYVSNRTGFIHRTFYDITVGIPDPSVFDIPRECM